MENITDEALILASRALVVGCGIGMFIAAGIMALINKNK